MLVQPPRLSLALDTKKKQIKLKINNCKPQSNQVLSVPFSVPGFLKLQPVYHV